MACKARKFKARKNQGTEARRHEGIQGVKAREARRRKGTEARKARRLEDM